MTTTYHHLMLPDDEKYHISDAELSAGVTPSFTGYPELDVRRYGAVGDESTDCLAAFNRAYLVAVAKAENDHGAEISIPEGKFRLSDEWDVWRVNSPRFDITIRGVDQLSSILVADFYGAGKSLIKCVAPNGTSRASPISIRDLGFENVSTSGGVNPVFVNVLGWGESRIDRVRFAGSNNTHLRGVSAQNIRGTDIVSFFGGRSFSYKSTSGLTFTVDAGANTITASGSIFSAGDVGKHFFVFPTDTTRRIRYTISGYTSPTVVSYSDTTDLAQSNAAGHFEPARCSISDNSTTLVANASCFTADMVGLVLYIRAGRTGAFGKGLLRATVASYTSTTTVELDTAATEAVVDEYFAVATIDMGLPPGWSGSSDVKIDKLHVEHYRGVAFVAQNNDSYHIEGKIHGESTPSDSARSDAACWLDDFAGKFEGELDTTCSMSDTRVYCCNFNDMGMFDALWSRGIINGQIFKTDLFTDVGGYLIVRGINTYTDFTDPGGFISDANYTADASDPRILLWGPVNMIGDALKARSYVGRDGYFLPDGRFVYGASTAGASFAATYSGALGARMAFEHIGTKRWSVGNTPGGGISLVIRDESAGADRWAIGGSVGTITPGTDNTQNIGSASLRVADSFSRQFRPGDGTPVWTSGTGTPEGAVTAVRGSLFTRTDGGAATTLYVKESGVGNTGWVAK